MTVSDERKHDEASDAFQKAWEEYDKSHVAGGWEKVGFIGGFGAGFKAGQAAQSESGPRPQVFTEQEVYNLNQYQTNGQMHPFTCGKNRTAHPDGEGILVATIYGWICPYCDYTQNWAHDFMKRSGTGRQP